MCNVCTSHRFLCSNSSASNYIFSCRYSFAIYYYDKHTIRLLHIKCTLEPNPEECERNKKKEIERNICNKALMKISCKTHQEQSFLFMNSSKVRQSHLHLTCLVNIENNEHFIFMCLKHMLFMNHIVACLE